jgi:acetyl-CoA C-acetyltransferase
MTSTLQTPVLVGVAQLEQRSRNPDEIKEPLDLMLDALNVAAQDAGTSRLLREASAVRVIRGIWSYANPAAALRDALGCSRAETALTPIGGNCVQTVLSRSALDIQRGHTDIVLMTGAEWGYSQARARREGRRLTTRETPGTPDLVIGDDVPMIHDAESTLGLNQPIQFYPLFENALRYARGEDVASHLARIARLWARFSDVAATNPHAWIRTPHSATEIGTPSAENRPVSFPYPKLMNSNNAVDQGAALILCSEAAARRLGIPEARWVYPWAGTDAHDHPYVSHRDNLHGSPAIRLAGRRCLELAGVAATDVELVDVYSCFPSAVQIAVHELGLDPDRSLTVTGGMTFAGGPLNNYVMHAIARLVALLREQRSARGFVTANGGFLTKHAFGVYSAMPPATPFRHEDLQAAVDATPRRTLAERYQGPGVIESYTVTHGPDGAPTIGFLAVRTPDERRTWARVLDPALLATMADRVRPTEFCGRRVTVDAGGTAVVH